MFITMLVIVPIMLILVLGAGGVVAAAAMATDGDQDAMTISMLILIPILFLGFFALSIVMNIAFTPLMIRAGLTQDFRASFDFPWIKDFIRKMWYDTFLALLFLMGVAMLASLLGLLACFVGIYPATAAMSLVQGHLYLQLYQLYLARGGEPIPLKPPEG